MYYTVIKHSGHLRTLEKCRKHSPAARVVYISFVFSNARRVLSQYNTRLRLLYLLSTRWSYWFESVDGSFERNHSNEICWKDLSSYFFALIKNHTYLILTPFSSGHRTLSLDKRFLSGSNRRPDKPQHHRTGKLLGLEMEFPWERLPSM